MGERKPILSMDFDGVIHSYSSGWRGARTIPDDPVPGALDFLVQAREHFEINIFSSRSNYILGRFSMQKWLADAYCTWIYLHESKAQRCKASADLLNLIGNELCHASFSEYDDHLRRYDAGVMVVRSFKWPKHKPPAMLTIDDRAMNFTGIWPDPESLLSFRPWNK